MVSKKTPFNVGSWSATKDGAFFAYVTEGFMVRRQPGVGLVYQMV